MSTILIVIIVLLIISAAVCVIDLLIWRPASKRRFAEANRRDLARVGAFRPKSW